MTCLVFYYTHWVGSAQGKKNSCNTSINLKGHFQFIVLPVCDKNLPKLSKRCAHAHAILQSYCTRILVAEEKSLTLFRSRSGPHACTFAMLQQRLMATIGCLLIITSLKTHKICHNFLIYGPILIIKVQLFSVFNTQCHGIKN